MNIKDEDIQLDKNLSDFIDSPLRDGLSSTALTDETFGVNDILQTASNLLCNLARRTKNKNSSTLVNDGSGSTKNNACASISNEDDVVPVESPKKQSDNNDPFEMQIYVSEEDVNKLMRSGKIFCFKGKLCYKDD